MIPIVDPGGQAVPLLKFGRAINIARAGRQLCDNPCIQRVNRRAQIGHVVAVLRGLHRLSFHAWGVR